MARCGLDGRPVGEEVGPLGADLRIRNSSKNARFDNRWITTDIEGALLGRLRVSRRRLCEPHGLVLVVDRVPEPSSTGHLVLPLLQLLTVDAAGAQTALERVLTVAPLARIGRELLPRDSSVSASRFAHLLPALGSVAGPEAKIPSP